VSEPKPALHDVAAEQAVLGSVFLMPETVHDVLEALTPDDFAKESHRYVFEAMATLSYRGDPIDVVTLSAALTEAGTLKQAGGMAYLATLDSAVPMTANVERYIATVRESAIRRRAISAFVSFVGELRDPTKPVLDVMQRAEAAVHAASDSGTASKRVASVGASVHRVFREIERRHDRQEEITGLPTGLIDFDRITTGLKGGDLIVLGARPSMGKAQPLDAPVLTPRGFVPMGSIVVGDEVIGANGKATRVVGVFPQGRIPAFRVWFSDGSSAECCDDHLWFTQTRNERRRGLTGSVKSLREIRATIERPDSTSPNHAIPIVAPVEFDPTESPASAKPLHPYLLGALLGDGSFRVVGSVQFDKPESDVQASVIRLLPAGDAATIRGMSVRIKREIRKNHTPSHTAAAIEALGLRGASSANKRVPRAYLFASVAERIDLLRGLLDTDGSVVGAGQVEFSTSSPQLANDVRFLVQSLGGILSESRRVPTYTHRGERKKGAVSYRQLIRFPSGLVPVSSEKHLARWRTPSRCEHRSIVSIEALGDAACQCIAVEAPDHLYVTEQFIVTHNTALVVNIAANVAIEARRPTVVFEQEMSEDSLTERLFASEGRVPSQRIRTGKLLDGDWSRLAFAADRLNASRLFIDDTPGITVAEMRSRCRRVRQAHGDLGLVVVDYLQLLRSTSDTDHREQQVAEFSRGMKALAREFNCPVIALSQLSRNLERREDKRPTMADLRESGAIEQDADLIVFVYRDEVYNPKTEDKGIAELIVAKQRNGPIGTVRVAFLKEFTRFENLAHDAQNDAQRAMWG
jgi:replicative DNA helicase